MKILKIEFQNINSLKGTHFIDFTSAPFTRSSLFAITGPTGSGKSTILDVISLSLFNHIPRLGKISRSEILNKGAILTRNQTEAFAKVTYESKSGIYTSHWSISTARTGNLREYEMEIINTATGYILDLKKSDVPARNEELIGLNYNQFIKSVLLAQGEFAQFIKAKKDERGELLEKITGTGIYRQLGSRAFEKFKLVNQEIDSQIKTIEVVEKNLLEEEEVEDLKLELAAKEKTCQPLEEELKILSKNLELKKTIETQFNEINKLSAEKESADLSLQEFIVAHGIKLEKHEKVRDFAEELRTWKRLTLECAGLDTELSGKTERENTNLKELDNCLKEVSGFTQLEVTQDKVEDHLREFSKKVERLTKELQQKRDDFENLQQIFEIETRELPCSLNKKDPESTIKNLEELKSKAESRIAELRIQLQEIDLEDPEAERIRLKKNLEAAREANSVADRMERVSSEVKRLKLEEEKIAPKLKDLPVEIRHNQDQVKIFNEKIQIISLKRENQLLLASLEDRRLELKDGEPCPLCGAVHHPYAENLPKKNEELDSQLQQVEQLLHHWNAKLAANQNSLQHFTKNIEEIQNQLKNQVLDFEKQKKEFFERYQYLQKGEMDWREICAQYEDYIDRLEQHEREKKSLECVHTGLPLVQKMIAVSDEGKELRDKLLSIYKGQNIYEDTQRFQTRWTRIKELEKAIGEQISELKEKIKNQRLSLQNLEKELLEKVVEKGFENLSNAGEAVLPDADYFKLQNGRDSIEKEIAKTTQSLKLLNSQLEVSRAKDVNKNMEELTALQKDKTTNLELVQKECQHLKRLLLNDSENREKIKKIESEIEGKKKEIRRWDLLNKLIGDSTGKRFNDFAQDLSLSHLLQLANVRLKDLSDRYRIDKPAGDEDDGLVAIDDHMGGQRRSVKTLSGGETFILSLSMALALSDLASKNVEINSLFIDEGFGTLDPETLDQTLDTLEKLQAESSKTIGIISHVDSLKERIATQIQLTRNGQGYSSLEVKGV